MSFRSLILASLITGLCATTAQADPVTLRLGYSDKESAFFLTGNGSAIPEKPGVAIEMVETAAASCDVAPTFARYPGGRLMALAADNTIDAVVLLSFSPERLAMGAFPMKGDAADPDFQIATLSYAFYVRADSDIAWDGKTLSGITRPIGANLGWSIVQDLKNMNLPVEPAKDTQNNFNKLLLARIDAVAMHTTIGDAYLEDNALAGKVKLLQPPITSKPYYLVFSHAWHAAHPGTADCMWQSIARQREATLPDLLTRYRDTIN